jgi:lauroyl/myristoyl acyltransferase
LHVEGARHVVFATEALWWLDHYESFTKYLLKHSECLLRNERVAVFRFIPTSSQTPDWRPVRRRDIVARRRVRLTRMLWYTTALQRLLPDDVALVLAAALGRVMWRHPGIRRRTEAIAKVILAGTPLAGRERSVARRHIVETMLRAAVWTRPWFASTRPIEGLEHLEAARHRRTGVVLVALHLGMHNCAINSLARRGIRLSLVAGNWINERDDERALQSDRFFETVDWVYKGGAFERLRLVLDAGGVCLMYADLPGGAKTTFVGKPANMARGPANLAMATGAQVITIWVERRGLRPVIKLNPALDPADFESADELTDHLANVFSDEVLRRPEALNADPALAGVWSDVIGEDAWAFVDVGRRLGFV